MTPAGHKLLQRFLDAEASGRLITVRDGNGNQWDVIELETGNGAQKACAARLAREGLAQMQWTRSQGFHRGRFLWITDAGRIAMAATQ